jgi:hypothetical protein
MREARDQISSYLLGELDTAEAAAFERRLDADPDLRKEVERLRPVVGRLEELPAAVWEAPKPPPLAVPEGAAEPPREPRGGPSPAGRRLRLPTVTLRPAPAAALAALLLAVGVASGLLIGGNGGSRAPRIARLLRAVAARRRRAHDRARLVPNRRRRARRGRAADPAPPVPVPILRRLATGGRWQPGPLRDLGPPRHHLLVARL